MTAVKAPLLIAIMGAECTGKTTLAQALARHFSGHWVPEHLRRFCEARGRTPTCQEQAGIVAAQQALETQAMAVARDAGNTLVLSDTAPLLSAIYSDFFFSDHSLYKTARDWHARYALTLLLAPDLPWVADGVQRDGAQTRDAIHTLIGRELGRQRQVSRIAGTGAARLQAAILAITPLLTGTTRQARP